MAAMIRERAGMGRGGRGGSNREGGRGRKGTCSEGDVFGRGRARKGDMFGRGDVFGQREGKVGRREEAGE